MEDGIYFEIFAIKDGERYNSHTINIKDVSRILTNSLLDGVEKIVTQSQQEEKSDN